MTKDAIIQVRVSRAEKQRLEAGATAKGLTLSEYVRTSVFLQATLDTDRAARAERHGAVISLRQVEELQASLLEQIRLFHPLEQQKVISHER